MKFTQKVVVIVLIIFVAVPLIIQLHLTPFYELAELLTPSNRSDWLSFWGSYLGVIPSGLIAALVAGYQIKAANKQSAEAREQDLIIMRNTKIVDYLYEIKNSVAKSKLILTDTRTFTSDDMLYTYLTFPDYQIFEFVNRQTLIGQSNALHMRINVVFNSIADVEVFELLDKYTKNLILVDNFRKQYYENEQIRERGIYGTNIVPTEPLFKNLQEQTIKEMLEQLEAIILITDKKLVELSA